MKKFLIMAKTDIHELARSAAKLKTAAVYLNRHSSDFTRVAFLRERDAFLRTAEKFVQDCTAYAHEPVRHE